ncbi:hypothetical protein GOP47_0014232 [Adiantum capillus-veneris]|uniref:Uncharacterized protein n=1 Tax=Adiantum capillus-veneris TaxID=13818 RepID=A0A9D4UL42_ADICA|nr:hypothetical protein GOP47_0014232 [Adiantum capillus-veneris]
MANLRKTLGGIRKRSADQEDLLQRHDQQPSISSSPAAPYYNEKQRLTREQPKLRSRILKDNAFLAKDEGSVPVQQDVDDASARDLHINEGAPSSILSKDYGILKDMEVASIFLSFISEVNNIANSKLQKLYKQRCRAGSDDHQQHHAMANVNKLASTAIGSKQIKRHMKIGSSATSEQGQHKDVRRIIERVALTPEGPIRIKLVNCCS